MNTFSKKIIIFVISGIVFFFGEYLRGQWFVNTRFDLLCHPYVENGKIYCHSLYQDLGFIFITISQVLAVVAILLLSSNASGFARWWRVSRWYLPISAILVIFLANSFSLPITGLLAPEFFVWLFGIPYILTTLGVVLWTRLWPRPESRK